MARSCPSCRASYADASLERCPADGSALVDAAWAKSDRLVGRLVAGRYRLLEPLGQGGMGTVYRAEHVAMRKPVAVKILRQDLSADPGMVARFQREARAASRIKSPHVIELFDFGEDEGLLYISMELLEGQSLAERLAHGPLDPRQAARVGAGIARALAAAHDAGVVHRDLKPDNVFVTRADGRVLVLDFGIARIAETNATGSESGGLTVAGAIVGTPLYMSPEAAAHKTVGPAGDLYSLGVVLFHMLVGAPPFVEKEMVLILGMHLRVPPELVRQARPGLAVPDAFEDLVDRLLEKDPEDRPDRAAAVAAALDAIDRTWDASAAALGRGPTLDVIASPTPTPHAATPIVATTPTARVAAPRRGWWLGALGVAAVLGLAVSAAVAGLLVFARPGDAPPSPAIALPAAVEEAPTAPAQPPPAEAARVVHVTLLPTPASAALTLDGRDVAAGVPIELPRDGGTHRVRASAPGHNDFEYDLVAESDVTLPIVLARAAIEAPAELASSRRRRGARRRAATSPSRRGGLDVIRSYP